MSNDTIEILVEEKSMEIFLTELLPILLPRGYQLNVNCFIRTHEGKSHLNKSIPKKARAYKHFPGPVKMIVIQDQDSNDCMELKNKIVQAISSNNSDLQYLVRIACKELENWYLGGLNAVELIYPATKASKKINLAKFRNPDNLNGSQEMKHLYPPFSKTDCAQHIVRYLDLSNNKSNSFNQLITGLNRFLS